MTDIDFDELDKAVNSLMSTANLPKDEPAQAAPTSAPVPASPTAPANPASAAEQVQVTTSTTPAPEAAPVDTPETPKATPAIVIPARKRSGRFMDMVHPSADMGTVKRPVTTPVSREGVTLAPVTLAVDESNASLDATEPTVGEELTDNNQIVDADNHTMPDPLEVTSVENEETVPEPQADESVETTDEPEKPEDKEEDTLPSDESAPAESPFLADAKVEKRPLGGEQAQVDDSTDDSETKNDVSESEKVDKDSASEVALDNDETPAPATPAELKPEVVAVEANEPNAFNQTEPETSDENTANATPTVAGNGAINQQYKEAPSTGDSSHTAIYDAANYPASAPKPGKKKSGWLWVLWIVILLALGAGAAVALYMLKIIP